MGSQNSIDKIILKNVDKIGFFVEAGGSDPRDQNNTDLLENNGWSGLIVEPKTEFNDLYLRLRPKSKVENYVLVDRNYGKNTILGDFSHYMMGGVVNVHGLNWNPTEYKCTTLDSLLKKNNINEVTFFSLDVEGYEIEVLNGVDFDSVFFHIIVVENHTTEKMKYDFSFLENFGFVKKFTIYQHEFYVNKKSNFFENFSL